MKTLSFFQKHPPCSSSSSSSSSTCSSSIGDSPPIPSPFSASSSILCFLVDFLHHPLLPFVFKWPFISVFLSFFLSFCFPFLFNILPPSLSIARSLARSLFSPYSPSLASHSYSSFSCFLLLAFLPVFVLSLVFTLLFLSFFLSFSYSLFYPSSLYFPPLLHVLYSFSHFFHHLIFLFIYYIFLPLFRHSS